MSKKKKIDRDKQKQEQVNKKKYYDAKTLLLKYIKRYGIILLITVPILVIFNYIMSEEVAWFHGVVSFFINIGLLLLACLIGLVIFVKKDEKEERESSDEKKRDPFAD